MPRKQLNCGLPAFRISSGRVIFSGAGASEVFDEGRGVAAASQPTISGALANTNPGAVLTVDGTLFTGSSEGSAGSHQSSPSDLPVVQVRRFANRRTATNRS